MKEIKIAPSILSADFSIMDRELKTIEDSNADWIHLDVMDGNFVPNITFGPKMIKDIRKTTKMIFDTHLMINNPGAFIKEYADSGSDYITIHQEAELHIFRCIDEIKKYNKKAGISIVPSTPVSMISETLKIVDLVLIMTVNPGFGGQSMIRESLTKIKELDNIRKEKGYNFLISVDGGVNLDTYREIVGFGADILVCGSAFFSAKNKSEFVEKLKHQ